MSMLPTRYWMCASAIAIYVAMFSGRFSFVRLFPGVLSDGPVLGEIRFWALLLAGFFALVSVRGDRQYLDGAAMQRVWRAVALVALVQCTLAIHALAYSPVPVDAHFLWELTTIVAVSGALGVAVRVWGPQFVPALAWVAVGVALAMAIWMFAASFMVQPTDPERPLATTFTFYRIQLFGGFAALFLLFKQRHWHSMAFLALVASVCFASAYLSLSKAALLAGTAGLLLLAAILAVWFHKGRAAVVLGVTLAATGIFILVSGHMFVARVSEGLLGKGYSMSTESAARTFAADAASTAHSDAFESQRRFAAVVACTAGRYACKFDVLPWEQDLADEMLRFHAFVPDYSFRIRLLSNGLRGISEAPWLGNGFGSFHAVAINLYTKQPEPYSHPHNIVVELLYSVGIVGTLFLFGVLAILLWEILRTRTDIESGLPLLMFVVSIAVGSVFGGDYMDFRLVWYGLLLCVMLSHVQNKPLSRMVQ